MSGLMPGVFSDRLGYTWDDPAARNCAARDVVAVLRGKSKIDHEAELRVMQLVDWYTRRDLPLSGRILVALHRALGLTKKRKRDNQAQEARRLKIKGLTAPQIAERLDISLRHVKRLYKEGAAAHGWASVADVVAAIEADADRPSHQYVVQRLHDAVRWFSNRGEALPYALWWALICGLGLGRGTRPIRVWRGLSAPELEQPIEDRFITEEGRDEARADLRSLTGWPPSKIEEAVAALGPTAEEVQRECEARGCTDEEIALALQGYDVVRGDAAYGLTDATISALCNGIGKLDGFQAAAKAVGEARAARYRPTQRYKCSAGKPSIVALPNWRPLTGNRQTLGHRPMSIYAIAKIAAKATSPTDHRRRRTDLNGAVADRKRTVKDWLTHADWHSTCRAYEVIARWNQQSGE